MTIFNNSNKERKHFKDKRSHQEINRGATTAATLEPSTPLSPARTRARARWQGSRSSAAQREFSLGKSVPSFKSAPSHAWSCKGSAMRSSPTELSGDLEKDAVFVSECSCRIVYTCIVVWVRCASIGWVCVYMYEQILQLYPDERHQKRNSTFPDDGMLLSHCNPSTFHRFPLQGKSRNRWGEIWWPVCLSFLAVSQRKKLEI